MYVVVGFAVLQFAGLCRCWCYVDWCLLWGLVVTFARSCLPDYGFRGWLGGVVSLVWLLLHWFAV